ncbi:hypothetical protein BTO01_20315 [Vibrio jasicida]|uniref:hypothetical protein n=1 Tax=Vibrio jasicida TaxID=766224 RepID=UPI000CF47ADA|nr:hypothetical protein [Vibrio jasicida]PQJ59187.1 hypothetical protein BTO01_20315 [Vibrio jasicida]
MNTNLPDSSTNVEDIELEVVEISPELISNPAARAALNVNGVGGSGTAIQRSEEGDIGGSIF